jgi:hypothetical protein
MVDVPKSLYRRYLEVSEATFQALRPVRGKELEKKSLLPYSNNSCPNYIMEGETLCRQKTLRALIV